MVFRFTGSGNGRTVHRVQKKMMISLPNPTLLDVVERKDSFSKELAVY